MPSAKSHLEALRARSTFCQQFPTSPLSIVVQIQQLSGLSQLPLRQLASLHPLIAEPPKPDNAILTRGEVSRF